MQQYYTILYVMYDNLLRVYIICNNNFVNIQALFILHDNSKLYHISLLYMITTTSISFMSYIHGVYILLPNMV